MSPPFIVLHSKAALSQWDIMNPDNTEARERYIAAPGGVRTTQTFSQNNALN